MQDLFNIDNLNVQFLENEPLSKHTTYKIGGPAKYFIKVLDHDSLIQIIEICKTNNLNWYVIGGGSNLLVSDSGFDGMVIKLDGDFKNFEFDTENKICRCGSAVLNSNILKLFLNNNYSGIEFLSGIPGTLGGAIKMNAGRKSEWISSSIISLNILDSDGNISSKNVDEIKWDYRYSSINNNEIVLSADIKYEEIGSMEEFKRINQSIENMSLERRESQPIDKLSCGSVFKNPAKNSAGKLIEEVGLKGKRCGGAQISDVHSNFIVNVDNAKAKDVLDLIQLAQRNVFEKTNIKLIPEVKFLGFSEKCSLF